MRYLLWLSYINLRDCDPECIGEFLSLIVVREKVMKIIQAEHESGPFPSPPPLIEYKLAPVCSSLKGDLKEYRNTLFNFPAESTKDSKNFIAAVVDQDYILSVEAWDETSDEEPVLPF